MDFADTHGGAGWAWAAPWKGAAPARWAGAGGVAAGTRGGRPGGGVA